MTADEPVAGVPRLCARRADCTRPRGHDDECGPDRADADLADLRAEVEQLEGEYQHVRQMLDADRATLLAVEGALGVCGCQATADVVARRVVAERDARQRQVGAVRAEVARFREMRARNDDVKHGSDVTLDAIEAALDAVEPADQPHPTDEAARAAAREASDEALAAATDGQAPDLLVALQRSVRQARVHSHPPIRPACPERTVDGQVRGECLNDDGSDR